MALVFLAGCASWSTRDHVLGTMSTVAIAGDVGTTIAALRDPLVVERNPLLGARPSPEILMAVGALGAGMTLTIADALPKKARPWWLAAITTVELALIVNNLGKIR